MTDKTTKPSINWDHVAPEYKWLARDAAGDAYLFTKEPELISKFEMWVENRLEDVLLFPALSASVFTSFDPGTCHWKESLVDRPKEVTP